MNFRKLCAMGLCLLPIALSGCELMHNLQPHRLRRLNRGSAPHLDPEFTRYDSPFAESMIVRAQNPEFDDAH